MNTTKEYVAGAHKLLDAVRDYLNQTARKHACPGFDCNLCSLNGGRYEEALAEVQAVLDEMAAGAA